MEECFPQPLLFMGVDRGLQGKLLGRFAAELGAAEIPLPDPTLPEGDYQRALSGLMLSPALPAALYETFLAIQEMADENSRNRLEDAFGVGALPAAAASLTDLEFAISAWLHDAKLFENLHFTWHVLRQHPFTYFASGGEPALPLPPPRPPVEPERLKILEAMLDAGSGRAPTPATRVTACEKDGETWFHVGAARTPERRRQDVVVYNHVRGELRMNCRKSRDLELFRRAFGAHLFGDAEHFQDAPRFTLAPLVTDGRDCLACADVDGIEGARLNEVVFMHRTPSWNQMSKHGTDIFQLVESGCLRFPPVNTISRVVFGMKFPDAPRPRRVTLIPPNRVLYENDRDSTAAGNLLDARGFMAPSAGAAAGECSKKTSGRCSPLLAA
jgi:hypothetical protein